MKKINRFRLLIPLPTNRKLIDCKYIFKIKYNIYDLVKRYKRRVIAKDYVQKESIDYNDIFFIIKKMTLIYTLLVLNMIFDMCLILCYFEFSWQALHNYFLTTFVEISK